MYGMVNRGLEDFVVSTHGDAAWAAIRASAGLDDTPFVTMSQYDDSVTVGLVGAAATQLGMTGEAVLEAFGEHWVAYAAHAGFRDVLQMNGASFRSFLQNLDAMHLRVALTFPNLQPPSFRCEDTGPNSLILHYHSTRAGLGPLVVGLVRGVARRFHTTVQVRALDSDSLDPGSLRFLVDYDS